MNVPRKGVILSIPRRGKKKTNSRRKDGFTVQRSVWESSGDYIGHRSNINFFCFVLNRKITTQIVLERKDSVWVGECNFLEQLPTRINIIWCCFRLCVNYISFWIIPISYRDREQDSGSLIELGAEDYHMFWAQEVWCLNQKKGRVSHTSNRGLRSRKSESSTQGR